MQIRNICFKNELSYNVKQKTFTYKCSVSSAFYINNTKLFTLRNLLLILIKSKGDYENGGNN